MSKAQIIFDYNQAINQAKKLEQLARNLEQLSDHKMNDTAGELKRAWQSDYSPQYYRKAAKVQEDIKETAVSVKKVAQGIRTTAEAVKRAELRALEIAKARKYR